MRILPGGRWVLAQLTDGSISYLDLQGLSKSQSPRLYLKSLIPATHRHQEFLTEWCDFAIDGMLAATLENHHLMVFNLAVGVSSRSREVGHGSDVTNRINVYCVRVVGSSLHAEHLSVFEDPLVDTLNGWGRLRLVGSHVAYVRRHDVDDEVSTQCVAVVEWQGLHVEERQADGPEVVLKRWLIPTPNYEVSVSIVNRLRMLVCERATADIVICRKYYCFPKTESSSAAITVTENRLMSIAISFDSTTGTTASQIGTAILTLKHLTKPKSDRFGSPGN